MDTTVHFKELVVAVAQSVVLLHGFETVLPVPEPPLLGRSKKLDCPSQYKCPCKVYNEDGILLPLKETLYKKLTL